MRIIVTIVFDNEGNLFMGFFVLFVLFVFFVVPLKRTNGDSVDLNRSPASRISSQGE